MENAFPRLVISNRESEEEHLDEWIPEVPRRPLYSQNYVTALLGPFDEAEERRSQIKMITTNQEKD